MKKFIALCMMLSMSAVFADDAVYGAFVLNSDKEQAVLCVPWVNPGSANGEIKVKDLIQTSTLVDGDQLFYYENGSYKAWAVNEGKWEGAAIVKASGVPEASAGGNEVLSRGGAVILYRPGVALRLEKRIIINGQVGTTPAAAMKMARAEGAAFTLIAPASPDKGTPIDSGWVNVQPGDQLIVGLMPYFYNGETKRWGTRFDLAGNKVAWSYPAMSPVIPAGQGAWFKAQGAAEEETTWDPAATSAN